IHAKDILASDGPVRRQLILSALLGAGAIASMAMAIEIEPGVFLDLRSVFLAASAALEGPWVGLATLLCATGYRIALGGNWVHAALIGMTLSSLVGMAGFLMSRRGGLTPLQVLLLALSNIVIPKVTLFLLPAALRGQVVSDTLLPGALYNLLAFLLI